MDLNEQGRKFPSYIMKLKVKEFCFAFFVLLYYRMIIY